jgi:predicted nucleic acid-binding protein
MRVVVADTSPLNYLVLIKHEQLLPSLYRSVVIPSAVHAELSDEGAPDKVRTWVATRPDWLEIASEAPTDDAPDLRGLGPGERAAILLSAQIGTDLLLVDDRRAVRVSERRGVSVMGTLGVLDLAATRGLISFADAVERLRTTNFRYPPNLLEALLKRHGPQI